MNKAAANDTKSSNTLYPAQLHEQPPHRPQQQPAGAARVSSDERMAREMQAQFDREARMPVLAQPAFPTNELPFNCGHCGMTHLVRHATHNAMFQCTRCKHQNRIAFQNNRPVVVLERGSWVPIPIFCNIQ